MFWLRDFAPKDLKEFTETAAEAWIRPHLQALDFDMLESSGPGWTGYWNGQPVGCGGFIEPYPGNPVRATAWAMMLTTPGPWFVHVHRAVKRAIDVSLYRRIEAHAQVGFLPAHRWLKMLGFKVETPVKPSWTPEGFSVTEYIILRDPL